MSPVLLALLEPEQAVTVLVLLGAVTNLGVLAVERRRWHVRWRVLGLLAVGAAPGLAVGVLLLGVAGRPALQVVVGVVVLVAVAAQLGLRAPRPAAAGAVDRRGKVRAVPRAGTAGIGVLVGSLSTTTGTNGPPMVLWFQHLGLPAVQLRDTLFVAFTGLALLAAPALAVGGGWDSSAVDAAALLVLGVATGLGRWAGWRVFRRLPEHGFRRGGLALVALLGAVSLVAGARGLV